MFGLIFRLIRLVALLTTVAVLGGVALAGYLLFSGGDSRPACAPPASGPFERAARSIAVDAKVVAFLIGSSRGLLSSVSLDEAETAARAESFFGPREDRVSEISLCFADAEAMGFIRLETLFGRDIGITGKGAVDLSGAYPRLRLSSGDVAGVPLPSFVLKGIEDRANDDLRDVPIVVPLKLQFSTDSVTLTR